MRALKLNDQKMEKTGATIGYVESQGNSTVLRLYSFPDKVPFPGNNYYRLKQIDLNGQYEYSAVRHILFEESNKVSISAYPNPSTGQFTIGINNPKGKSAIIQLYTSSGSLIWTQEFVQQEMPVYWTKEFNLEQRELYYVVSQVGEEITFKKIVIIKKD